VTEIAFYHLTKSSQEQALPLLLGKTLSVGKRALVMAESKARVEALNGALWVDDKASWLPHGSSKDGQAEDQPVWLTDTQENPNGAAFLFLTDGVECADLTAFERCFELFDGTSEDAVKMAREHWRSYREQGHNLTYWQQTDSGGWQKKDT